MFAESVRMPLKSDQSSTGVLPVAISTIIVSPTARPKPTMIAEKMPGLAVGSTTRDRGLPAARAEGERGRGQVLRARSRSASSAIVKMIGITAKPIARPTTRQLRWS